MKLEDQVTSLELSKKLKGLGVKQESVWYWVRHNENDPKFPDIDDTKWELLPFNQGIDSDDEGREWTVKAEALGHNPEFWEVYSAFTVAELGEMLQLDKVLNGKIIVERGTASHDWYVSMESGGGGVQFAARIEANARTKMLIYLIENKLLNP